MNKKYRTIISILLFIFLCLMGLGSITQDEDANLGITIIFAIVCFVLAIIGFTNKKEIKDEKIKAKKKIKKGEKLNEERKIKLMDKEEVNSYLGDNYITGFMGKGTYKESLAVENIKYMGGVEELDEIIDKNEIENDINSNIEIHIKGIAIKIKVGFNKKYRVALASDNIKFWTIESQKDIIGKKSKSVVGRALVGGLLFGGAGAIVGAMTGSNKEFITASGVDNIISIKYDDFGVEKVVLFSVSNKYLKKTYEIFKNSTFGEKFKNADELVENKEGIGDKRVADELIKLKKLLDDGVLTEEEFKIQKEKLLK